MCLNSPTLPFLPCFITFCNTHSYTSYFYEIFATCYNMLAHSLYVELQISTNVTQTMVVVNRIATTMKALLNAVVTQDLLWMLTCWIVMVCLEFSKWICWFTLFMLKCRYQRMWHKQWWLWTELRQQWRLFWMQLWPRIYPECWHVELWW